MTRSVPEWIADHDDQAIPPRVQLRVVERHDGRCPACGRPLVPGKFAIDHVIALANGGKHREKNLQPLCDVPCHADKTGLDVATKSRGYHQRLRGAGLRKSRHPIAGWRKFDNTPVRNPKLDRSKRR